MDLPLQDRPNSVNTPRQPVHWSRHPIRLLWFCIGISSVALGGLGIFLPLLPTTPFLLLAAFSFAESSQRWHDWLHQHRIFGPIIADWHRYGAIERRTKFIGVSSMLAAFALSVAMQLAPLVLIIQALALTCSAIFVLTRPTPPKADSSSD